MNSIDEIIGGSGPSHHAYIIEGNSDSVIDRLGAILNGVGISTKGSPDYFLWKNEVFGINEARDLKERQSRKNIDGKQIFIVKSDTITREAQNALLKVFEEPCRDTYFFLVVSSADIIIPTLKSRMIVTLDSARKDLKEDKYRNILHTDKASRMEILRDIVENKDRREALRMLDSMEMSLSDIVGDFDDKEELEIVFKNISNARALIRKRQGSLKLLMENAVLSLPYKS
jgi:DNA polymerase III delta prime subunit